MSQIVSKIAAPSIIVIFGITGDLSQRKLLPALYTLLKDELLDPETVILGISRREVTAEELLSKVELCVNEIDQVCDKAGLQKVKDALRMHTMDLTDPAAYRDLKKLLDSIEAEKGVCMDRLYNLSIPPQMFEPIVRNLGQQGLNESCIHGNAASRLLVEKPFGFNLQSARDLIEETTEHFHEDQLFRIDHYLAKDTVLRILQFRSTIPEVEEVWNNQYINDVTITAYEKIDIEGRATFYEEVGALRDFIQSHLLQLLAVVTMDLPDGTSSDAVHEKRLKLLQEIQPISEMNVAAMTTRGQYAGYREEVQNARSHTETFARVRLIIPSQRWESVSMTLQTGKAMSEKRTDVCVTFTGGNTLTFHIQPDKPISLSGEHLPEFLLEIEPKIDEYNTTHPAATSIHPDAYERVLLDAVRGDHTLFTTSAEVEAAWKVVTDVVDTWAKNDEGLLEYRKGAANV